MSSHEMPIKPGRRQRSEMKRMGIKQREQPRFMTGTNFDVSDHMRGKRRHASETMNEKQSWRRRVGNKLAAATVATGLALGLGQGAAEAAPVAPSDTSWLDVGSQIETNLPAGAIVSQTEWEPLAGQSETVEPSLMKKISYADGTGGVTSQLVLMPVAPYEGDGPRPVLVESIATDSVHPEKNPTEVIPGSDLGGMSDSIIMDTLAAGGVVILPNAYGDGNLTYAGKDNGMRVSHGISAAKSAVDEIGNSFVVVDGFSGGAFDSLATAQYGAEGLVAAQAAAAPSNVEAMLDASSGAMSSGLIIGTAAPSGLKSNPEIAGEVSKQVRPSVKAIFNIMKQADGMVPVLAGALVGIDKDWLMVEGADAMENPSVRQAMEEASLNSEPNTVPVRYACDDNDMYLPCDSNGKLSAKIQQEMGTGATFLSTHSDALPGHAPLESTSTLEYFNQHLPEGSKFHIKPRQKIPPTPMEEVAGSIGIPRMTYDLSQTVFRTLRDATPETSKALGLFVSSGLDLADAVLNAANPLAGSEGAPVDPYTQGIRDIVADTPAPAQEWIRDIAPQYSEQPVSAGVSAPDPMPVPLQSSEQQFVHAGIDQAADIATQITPEHTTAITRVADDARTLVDTTFKGLNDAIAGVIPQN